MTDANASRTREWVEKIGEQELASLTIAVRKVQAVLSDERSSIQQLSEALLKDPVLTAKLLRIANSPSYSVSPEPVTTVTRASALLGFDAIRNICITSRLLESLLAERVLTGTVRERLLRRTASSLHAAIQARIMMGEAREQEREEVFIAALLRDIGEIAFWSLGSEEACALSEALDAPDPDTEKLVREHVGSSFGEISASLIRSWGLGALLAGETDGAAVGTREFQLIGLAHEVADCVAREGWHSAGLSKLLPRAAILMNTTEQEARRRLRACGQEAEQLAVCYGAGVLASRMALKPAFAPSREDTRPGEKAVDTDRQSRDGASGTSGDPALQLKVLQELTAMMQRGPDVNSVICMAMEGVHQGIGMDRTVTALVSPDRKSISTRFSLGDAGNASGAQFSFSLEGTPNILQSCIQDNRVIHQLATAADCDGLPEGLASFSAYHGFLLAPIRIGERSIGVLYADRALSGRPIRADDFNAFRHFANQLAMCLTFATQTRH
jgi:HD-like signal output (HDOD) protein